jgi:DNA end-binding protein Ku
MRYADEVLPAEGLAPEGVDLTDKERDMARQLVESLAAEEFEPEKYHDEYREQLLDLIARKESGEEILAQPQTEAPAKVLDLVAALEASIEKSKTAKERHPSGTGSQAAPATKSSASKRTTKPATKATKAPAKKAARAKRSA